MVTVTGTFLLADGTPDSGSVRLAVASPAVLRDADPALVTAADVRADLDGAGQVAFDVVASDDPGWATEDPVPYRVSIRVAGMRADYLALVTADCDIADLITLPAQPIPVTPDVPA